MTRIALVAAALLTTAAITRGVAAELGPLANTQAKPDVGPFATPPKP